MADLEAEAALLGSVLDRHDVAWPHAARLEASDFAWPSYATVFEAMRVLVDSGRVPSPIAVVDQLRLTDALERIGHHDGASTGAAVVYLLSGPGVGGWAMAGDYAAIVARHATERRLADAATRILTAAKAGDIDGAACAIELASSAVVAGPARSLMAMTDLGPAMRGEVPELVPTMLRRDDGVGLIYPGLTHWLMGEPGKGKTFVALHAVAEVVAGGGRALYLDWEGNHRIVGSRLRALGVDPEIGSANIAYLRPRPFDRASAATLAALVAAERVDLVVCDGVAKALARQGLNEDKAPDVLAWLELVVNPLADAGAAVLMLDHVTKDKDGRGMWARGSGAKLGEVSGAAWLVVPRQGFSRHQGGRIDLLQAKDREGYVAADGSIVASVAFMPADGGSSLSVRIKAPDSAGEFRPTGYMERVSRALEGLPDAITWNALRTVVRGRLEHVRVALELLVSEGFVTRESGPRNSQLLRSSRPFREADETAEEHDEEETLEQF